MAKFEFSKKIKKFDPWFAENCFYLNASPERISKFIAHYEIFTRIKNLKGDIVECGVFRGASFTRFINFDKIFSTKKNFYAFDAFGKFPESGLEKDRSFSKLHDKKIGYGIEKKELNYFLKKNKAKNFKLIKGDVLQTLEAFTKKKRKISLLHLDLDVYLATKYALEKLYPYVVKKGIILIDDYNHISNTTKAVKEFLKKRRRLKIEKFKFPCRPSFIVKY